MRAKLLWLLILGSALGCAGPATVPIADEPMAETPGAPEQAAPQLSQAESLQRDIDALEALLNGTLPNVDDPIDPQSLFEVNLSDEVAVAARRGLLVAEMGLTAPSDLTAPEPAPVDAGTHTSAQADAAVASALDAGVVGDASVDAAAPGVLNAALSAVGLSRDAAVSRDARPHDASSPDGSLVLVVVPPTVAPVVDLADQVASADDEDEITRLTRRRDTLRLRFLRLPAEDRRNLMQTVQAAAALNRRTENAAAILAAAQTERTRAHRARAMAEHEASSAQDVEQRSQAQTRATLQEYRATLANQVAIAAAAAEDAVAAERARLEVVHRVRTSLRQGSDAETNRILYRELVEVLVQARQSLRDVLEASVTVPAPPIATQAAKAVRDKTEMSLEAQRWELLQALADEVHDANDLRLQLLRALPSERQRALLGFGADGRTQLLRELEQVRVMGRYAALWTYQELGSLPADLWRAATRSSLRGRLGTMLLVFVLGVWGWRRRNTLFDAVAARLWKQTDGRRRVRVAPWWRRLRTILPPLWVAGVALLLLSVAFVDDQSPVPTFTRYVILALTAYRAFVALLGEEIVAWRYLGSGETREAKRDVRLVGRWALASGLLLMLTAAITGRGTLYAYLSWLLILLALFGAALLLRRRREAVARAYHDRHPDDRLAAFLSAPGALRRYAATLPAALLVGAETLSDGLRSTLLRFAAGRRAVALFKRRRVDEAETEATESEAPETALPPELVLAFTLDAVEPSHAFPHFPRLEELVLQGQATSVVLVGEMGSGKTSYLRMLHDKLEGTRFMLAAPPGADDAGVLCRFLADALGLPESDDPRELSRSILESNMKGVVLLDDTHNLFMRHVGGTAGFHAFAEIVGSTQAQLSWVCTMGATASRYLMSAQAGQSVFMHRVVLDGWSVAKVTELVDYRMATARLTANFEDLIDGDQRGSARRRRAGAGA